MGRMFGQGKGFLATVKCQRAFTVGCIADVVSLVVAAKMHVGWEMPSIAAVMGLFCWWVFRTTRHLLYSSASILGYWREDRGGKPAPDDPYDLAVPVACMKQRAEDFRKVSAPQSTSSTPQPGQVAPHAHSSATSSNVHHHGHHAKNAAVRALF